MAVLQFPRTLRTTQRASGAPASPIRLLSALNSQPQCLASRELLWGISSGHALMKRLVILGKLAPNAPLSFLAVRVSGLYVVNPKAADTTLETLLQAVIRQVGRLTRATDMAGRLGASSFGVVLQGTDATAAAAVAARLSIHLNETAAAWPGSKVFVSAATGTGVNALVLPSAALDTSADCC